MIHTYQNPDPIAESLEREDEYWQSIGGRDPEPTYKSGWNEQWELLLDELEREGL